MQLTNSIYLKYQNLVFKYVHRTCKTFNIPFEDLIGLGNEIFCKAVHSFDESKKTGFSTHLHYQLLRLVPRAKVLAKKFKDLTQISCYAYDDFDSQISFEVPQDVFEEALSKLDPSQSLVDLKESIRTSLSPEAQEILKALFNGTHLDFKGPGGKPSRKDPVELLGSSFGYPKEQRKSLKREISQWWADYAV